MPLFKRYAKKANSSKPKQYGLGRAGRGWWLMGGSSLSFTGKEFGCSHTNVHEASAEHVGRLSEFRVMISATAEQANSWLGPEND